jgi:outer membrane protein W
MSQFRPIPANSSGTPSANATSVMQRSATMRRFVSFSVVALVLGLLATPPVAAQQSVNFYIGGFVPRAEDARSAQDVLVGNKAFLIFDVNELTGPTVGGEWLIGFGDKFEGSLGLGFYQRSTPAADRFNEFKGTGDPIIADLKLRVVPFTATVRFLPLGHHYGVQPYIGAGVGVLAWRYSEAGDFVANDGVTIIHNSFVGSGSTTGPVILGGLRVGAGSWGVGGEIRYQAGEGDLPTDKGFAGSKIDLGGFNYLFTVGVRF